LRDEVEDEMVLIGWYPPKNYVEIYALYKAYLGIKTNYPFKQICNDIGITKSKLTAFDKKNLKAFSMKDKMKAQGYLESNITFLNCILSYYKMD
jgi:hypothetical protein